jgi:methylated-DNA-[protein]-cysteine S-methyltransferase
MQRTTFVTAIGRCAISWHDGGLAGFSLPEAIVESDDVVSLPIEIQRVIARVQRHLEGHVEDFSDLAYDFGLTSPFNAEVLRATLGVKAGVTRSYGDIARAIGQPTSASRAVGTALGENRWPLLIPCHRIVSSSGKMTGFSGPGGIKTKLRLLALEGAQLFSE